MAKKPWYNHECKILRKEYHRSKNYNRRKKNQLKVKINMVIASRAYKKAINRQFKSYQNSILKKVRDLQTTKQKAYWSIINKSCESKQTFNEISKHTAS